MVTYKNISQQEQIVPNIGVVAPNGTVETNTEIINSNFTRITNETTSAPSVPTPPAVVQPSTQPAYEPKIEEN